MSDGLRIIIAGEIISKILKTEMGSSDSLISYSENLRWCSKFFSDDPKLHREAVNEFQMNYEKMKSGNIRNSDKCSY